MQSYNLYKNAHLFVSAIRIIENQNKVQPSVKKVCEVLSISLEFGNLLANKLIELDIIDIVAGAYDNKLFIKNHLKIEDISKEDQESKLDEAFKKFQGSRRDFSKEIEAFKTKQEEKKGKLFSEIEKHLKNKLEF